MKVVDVCLLKLMLVVHASDNILIILFVYLTLSWWHCIQQNDGFPVWTAQPRARGQLIMALPKIKPEAQKSL